MSDNVRYPVPANRPRIELVISRSRFVATAGRVASADDVRCVLTEVRAEMPGATHHAYAFRIGFGNTVREGASDDGEPSGTAGAPMLAVLRGRAIGDVMVVVTRFYGGVKLGTGGLVRAYSDAARGVLNELSLTEKVLSCTLRIELPYRLYEPVKLMLLEHEASVISEDFAEQVTVTASIPQNNLASLTALLADSSAGKVVPVMLDRDWS